MAGHVSFPGELAPDGGWGWIIVAACFITTICTRAVTRCMSILLVEFQTQFSRDYSGTAWIPSLVDCTTMLCAPLGSYVGKRWSSRVSVMAGGLVASLGLILSSFATRLEHLYLSLGILTGLGFALCYTPAITTVGAYFSERKALAYGIAFSGSSIGTSILAPAVQLLIEFYSWRGALLILGGLDLHLCACGALMRPLRVHRQKNSCTVEEGEFEGNMLKSKQAEAKLRKGLNLEDAQIQQKYKLEMVGSNCVVINGDEVKSGDLGNEDRSGKEQAEVLLCSGEQPYFGGTGVENTDSEQAGVKIIDSTQRDTNLEKKKHEEDPVLTDRDIKENWEVNSKTGGANGILEKTTRDSKQNTNGKFTSMMHPTILNTERRACPSPSISANADLPGSKQPDTNRAVSQLAALVPTDSKMLCEKVSCKCAALIDHRAKSRSRAKEGDACLQFPREFSVFLQPDVLLLAGSFVFLAFGCNVPFVYLPAYSLSIGAAPQQAALVISVMGMMGIVGNITFGWISDRKCLRAFRVVTYLLAVGLDGLICLFLPLSRTFSLLVPLALFYGYFDGAYVALIPVVTANIVGPTYFSSALGLVYFLHAIPYLISPPMGGWLVDRTGSYMPAFLLGGTSLICSAAILAIVTLARCSCRGRSRSCMCNTSK
ncbi:monocarboxylate transporter 12-B-like [Electrophorus electricus]|uniref:monocarboxylate transporter 12-B-like n=1 Tax=Electrophorus electricus TaxID=8005 RepID=UPI0015D00245|nr:monocarboxylate transporter 12-B-like [Electrophorus electricus]